MLHALALLGIVGGSISNPATTPSHRIEETVVVTASLLEDEKDELPAAVTVIGAGEIVDRQATAVADLLRTVPGLDVVGSGSPGKAVSVFGRGTNSNQTLVLWNGVELNDPFFGGFDWAFLPTDGVERVEIVRGPFSSLYGSDALGGVVQVVSGTGDGVDLALEAGADEYRRGSVVAGESFGAARLDVAASVRRGEGEVANDSYDGEDLAARLGWTPAMGVTLGLVARAAAADVGIPYDFAGLPSPRRLQERRTRQLALPAAWRGALWRLDGQLSRHTLDLGLSDPEDPFAASRSESEAVRGRLVAGRSLGTTGSSWVAFGGEWERQQASSASAFGPGLADDSQRTWAGFAELHAERGPWAVDLGARRDDNDAFGAHATGRAGVQRRLGRGVRLHAAWAQGFRAPSLGDLYFPGFGNPELEPEASDSLEAGVDWRRDRWDVELTAFRSEVEDLIVFDLVTNLPQNVGRARSRGIELASALAGRRGWARLAVTWLDAEDLDSGEPLARRPRWRGALLAGWRGERWRLSGTLRHVGDRTDIGTVPLDGYQVLDLAARCALTQRLAPYARLENVLDEEYEEAAGFPARGIGLVGGLALHLGGAR